MVPALQCTRPDRRVAAPFATAPAFRAATLVVLGAAHMIPLTHPAANRRCSSKRGQRMNKKTTKKTTDISDQDRESSTTPRNWSLSRTNGNGAGMKQLPALADEPEVNFDDTAHEF